MALLQEARVRGFADAMLCATVQSPLSLLPLAEIDEYRSGTHHRDHLRPDVILEELYRRHAYGMLVKGGNRPRTSRTPGVVARHLDVSCATQTIRSGEAILLELTALNTGDTLWLSQPNTLGGYVTVGVKLLTEAGRLVDDAPGRTALPRNVGPGESLHVSLKVTLPALPPGRYSIEIDLVDELVCWFGDLPGTTKHVRPITVV